MADWKNCFPPAVVGGALGGLAAIGLGFAYMRYRNKTSAIYVGKTHGLSDPLNVYLRNHNVDDEVLGELRDMSTKLEEGKMTTAVETCKLITFYVRALNAKKCLDIGVFTGCSAFAMALGLPDEGKVIACDISENFTSLGKPFWERGRVSGKIDLRLQPATQTLQELIDNGETDTFDLMFIDADKGNYGVYYELGMELLRKGGLVVVDNALWKGQVVDTADNSEETVAIRELNKKMRDDPRVEYVLLTISDGVGIAQKL